MVDGGAGQKENRSLQTSAYSGKEGFGGHDGRRGFKKINVRGLFSWKEWSLGRYCLVLDMGFAFVLVMMRL